MSYQSGFLKDRIDLYIRKEQTIGEYGIDTTGIEWQMTMNDVPANVGWVKGLSAMREGAIDVYGIIEVRMRYVGDCYLNMRGRIGYDGQMYQILPETYHRDYSENTLQFNAQIIINEL